MLEPKSCRSNGRLRPQWPDKPRRRVAREPCAWHKGRAPVHLRRVPAPICCFRLIAARFHTSCDALGASRGPGTGQNREMDRGGGLIGTPVCPPARRWCVPRDVGTSARALGAVSLTASQTISQCNRPLTRECVMADGGPPGVRRRDREVRCTPVEETSRQPPFGSRVSWRSGAGQWTARVSLSGHPFRESTQADCGVRHTLVARSHRSECAWEGHGGRCRSPRWQVVWEQPTMSVDLGRVRSAVRLQGRHGRRRTLNVTALCGPFRNGGASALFRRRRTVCPLLSRCRTSRDTASRHARNPPFKVCRSRRRAISPTPPPSSWLSVPAGAQPVARVFSSPCARACYGRWRGQDGASRGGSGTSAAVCDDRRRHCSGDVPAGRHAHDCRRLRVPA